MKSEEIRKKFLDFFEKKGHKIVSSAPIVVQNDPTLMFTNAGMNQFKDYFLGNKSADNKRVADTQKCLRVSGKHNDLEEVGHDTYHHTMFEMLGNWSFGNYFKEEAIKWAWELLTEVYGLPENRLYVTVFEGDNEEGLDADVDSRRYWKDIAKNDRILNGSKADNFWEMGDTGPCGPCSEIHIDLRTEDDIAKIPGSELVNKDHPLVVEVWNLVFIQFNRRKDGSLENLPEKHVDTGMGFERLAMAVQGKASNYDTDIFQPLIQELAGNANVRYGEDEKIDIALRVVADHLRAICFTIADGQLPGNAKAGYVIRRILRRAVRYGYTFLGFTKPFMHELIPTLVNQFQDVFPEIAAQSDFISRVVVEEEQSFLRTLDHGLKKFDQIKEQADNKIIDGKVAFELYDTYGFPIDLTALIAKENGLEIDIAGFDTEMSFQKSRSRQAGEQDAGDWSIGAEAEDHSRFLGYEESESKSIITRYRKVVQKESSFYQIVLDVTPFYAESGGQVGDIGWLEQEGQKVEVFDTKKENDLIVHFTKSLPPFPDQPVDAKIDVNRRENIQNNHSATHLLHAALREVLGDHVQQRGSLVNERALRFDFSHFSKVSEEEITKVEDIVNKRIRQNITKKELRNVPIDEAREMGAMALFGEKYGEFVRVIVFDESHSVELCGGTHVTATGQIGTFRIVSESSISTGVRRIEAVTAGYADDYVNERLNSLKEVQELLKLPKDVIQSINDLLAEKQEMARQLEMVKREKTLKIKEELKHQVEEVDNWRLIFHEGQFPDQDAVKQIAFDLKKELPNLLLMIAADVQGTPNLTVMISDDLVKEKQLNASDLVRIMAKSIQGGGGGQPFFATAGGKNVGGLRDALNKGKSIIYEKLGVSE